MSLQRKYRGKRDRSDAFDANSFRRQSAALADDGGLNRINSGGRPRPPTMIERHYANLTVPGAPPRAFSPNPPNPFGEQGPAQYAEYPAYAQPSFEPGQIVRQPSADAPFYNPMGQTPMGSPTVPAQYASAYDAQGRPVRSPSAGAGVALGSPSEGAHYAAMDRAERVQRDRTSVTPFQQQQYAAIQRQLGEKGESPFADPRASPPHDGYGRAGERQLQLSPPPTSSDYSQGQMTGQSGTFSPLPPPLRPFAHAHSGSFPVTPSPMETSFNIESPEAALKHEAAPAHMQSATAAHPASGRRPGSMYSMYDDEDAYGGM